MTRRGFGRSGWVLAAVLPLLLSGCAWITRVSVGMGGSVGNGDSLGGVALSGDGRYVAFQSAAGDLVAGDHNGVEDVFERDLRTGVTTRVSVDPAGRDADGYSAGPSMSADGRFVAFVSYATNLVAGGDHDGEPDVYVRDTQTQTTTRVTVTPTGGDPADGIDGPASISPDGRYVAFASYADDLVPGDTNNSPDVFLRDLQTGTTTLVSVNGTGGGTDRESNQPVVSSGGRYVSFDSHANDLVPNDNNGKRDVFVRDLQTNTTTLVSQNTVGIVGNNESFGSAISADGRYVAFGSYASDLVANDNNGTCDAFVRDLELKRTVRATVDVSGNDANACGGNPVISADGRFVVFTSTASNLVPGDQHGYEDVFVRDLQTNTTTRASANVIGVPANSQTSYSANISGDGRYVAFTSSASNLVSGDNKGASDVFERAVLLPVIDSVEPTSIARGSTVSVTIHGREFTPGARVQTRTPLASVKSFTVVSDREIDASVRVDSGAAPGPLSFDVLVPGPGPQLPSIGTCAACSTIVDSP